MKRAYQSAAVVAFLGALYQIAAPPYFWEGGSNWRFLAYGMLLVVQGIVMLCCARDAG